MALKKVMFGTLAIGDVFHRNRIGYTKTSSTHATVNTEGMVSSPPQRGYFDHSNVVEVGSK